MAAKDILFDRLKYLDAAIKLPALIDDGIMPSEHNGAANLLRKGIGIVAFNILEDFIKTKSLETLRHISDSGINFSKLPEKLQEATTLGALNALAFKAKVKKKEGGDWKRLVQTEALKIYSTNNVSKFELSEYSLVSANSNILPDEVVELMKAFGIDGGWIKIKSVSDAISGGVTDLSQSYKNAAERRHNAAHAAQFNYEYPWLTQIKSEILAIAASLDILLIARCRQISSDLTKEIKQHNIDSVLNYRFLELSANKYRETTSVGGKAVKIWNSISDATNHIKPKLSARNEFLVVLDSTKRIVEWYT